MNPVSKSQASSRLIQNIERNKSKLDYFAIFSIINYLICVQIHYGKKAKEGLEIEGLQIEENRCRWSRRVRYLPSEDVQLEK